MADDKDKPTADKPVGKAKPVKEPKAEEPKADDKPVADAKPIKEPKVEKPSPPAGGEEPVSSPAAPADDVATPVGTDQHGRQLYSVKCAGCGKQAEVPFKPSGGRPVYCKDCYMQQRGGRTGGGMNRGPRR